MYSLSPNLQAMQGAIHVPGPCYPLERLVKHAVDLLIIECALWQWASSAGALLGNPHSKYTSYLWPRSLASKFITVRTWAHWQGVKGEVRSPRLSVTWPRLRLWMISNVTALSLSIGPWWYWTRCIFGHEWSISIMSSLLNLPIQNLLTPKGLWQQRNPVGLPLSKWKLIQIVMDHMPFKPIPWHRKPKTTVVLPYTWV